MRIVLDTNVLLVSISERSPFHWIFKALISGHFMLCVTTDILLEYAEVLERHMGAEVSDSVLGVLDNLINVYQITSYYRFDLIKKDKDDNKFVDCAIAANAHYLVTEDQDFNVLNTIEFPKVKVLRTMDFHQLLNEGYME
jgi:uncharacterized protein